MKDDPLKNGVKQNARNELRTIRLRTGLSQDELGTLLGYPSDVTVSRHERSKSVPPLFVALCYETILRAPISRIFVGLRDQAERQVEKRILQFEAELESSKNKRTKASPNIAQKLAWLTDHRNSKDEFNA
jgi:DNA-binding XRE family transcriptional regulator